MENCKTTVAVCLFQISDTDSLVSDILVVYVASVCLLFLLLVVACEKASWPSGLSRWSSGQTGQTGQKSIPSNGITHRGENPWGALAPLYNFNTSRHWHPCIWPVSSCLNSADQCWTGQTEEVIILIENNNDKNMTCSMDHVLSELCKINKPSSFMCSQLTDPLL